jgi:hypothetical protein
MKLLVDRFDLNPGTKNDRCSSVNFSDFQPKVQEAIKLAEIATYIYMAGTKQEERTIISSPK